MGVAYVGCKLARRYVLYVSATQDQADKHVQSIATMLEQVGVERSVGKYGNSRGWRRDQLRTATGFNVEAMGLDTASRGVKLDEFRPDLIILDDIDGLEDTPETTAKKIRAITKSLIPAGSANCAVLVIQNLIIEDGIMSQLVDGRADWLSGRECYVEPAVIGLRTEIRTTDAGISRHTITAGVPTWDGQDLETCERQINDWGLRAFLEEAQHEVSGSQGLVFDVSRVRLETSCPPIQFAVRGWDTAATQGAGDYTVGVLMGVADNGSIWVLDVVRGQFSPERVSEVMRLTTEWDRSVFRDRYMVRVPQDPGSAGKRLAVQDRADLDASVRVVTGRKATRARKFADALNSGNVHLVPDNLGRTPELDRLLDDATRRTSLDGRSRFWRDAYLAELRRFREDEKHAHDDQVDASADAYNELIRQYQPPKPHHEFKDVTATDIYRSIHKQGIDAIDKQQRRKRWG